MVTTNFSDLEIANIFSAKARIRLKMYYFQRFSKNYLDDMFLSGGAIESLLQAQEPKDWDVYFKTQSTQNVVLDHFKIEQENEIADYDEKYRDLTSGNKIVTENATTLKNGIQLITKHNGQPQDIRSTFDFVHCMPYYELSSDILFISREQYDLCVGKILKINNPKTVTSWRQSKFEQRGYKWQS